MGRRSFRNKNFYPKTHCYTAHGRVAESVEAKHRENERKREKKETEREREKERERAITGLKRAMRRGLVALL